MSEPPHFTSPPPPYQGEPPGRNDRAAALMATASVGIVAFIVLDFVAIGIVMDSGALVFTETRAAQITLAVLLAGVAFGGGGALCFVRAPWARGFGIGLMIGWALLSIVSGGLCTGLNTV